ncbi:membrane protein [Marmoricola endophyticus]|uniref:Membrane protein n=1 Tax=Marmoricola endophyticus TaxID=2040280 RepID=A0A917BPK3_9ACTN|nr:C39 family peptidase [Marmoricola endophyticus]GGF52080.1 membrane protein [Marmoricola endophyticus]
MRPLPAAVASLLLGAAALTVPAGAASAAAPAPGSPRYASVVGAGFAGGTHNGTAYRSGRLVLDHATSTTASGRGTLENASWYSGWVTPGTSFTELIASWKATTAPGSFVRIGLQAKTTAGTYTSVDDTATWAEQDDVVRRASASAQPDDTASVATDTFKAHAGTRFVAWRMRVVLTRPAGKPGPSVVKVGGVASTPTPWSGHTSAPLYGARTLAVPTYSQMTHRGEYPQYGNGGEAWCSPTSVAMLLGYYKRLPPASSYAWVAAGDADRYVDGVARMTYDYAYQGTGNWPFNTAVAATYAGDAFVTRLTSLRDVEQLVHAGIPVAISVSFGKGELSGAPISASNGHLVVVSGFTAAGNPVVNDPAGPSNGSVRRTYDRGQLERAWMGHSYGTAYIVRDAAHPLPPAGSAPRW